MTEDQLEQETLGWLADVGYSHCYGLDTAPDGSTPERSSYNQVLLVGRLREAINRLNPHVPLVAQEDALQQMLNLDTRVWLAVNQFSIKGAKYTRRPDIILFVNGLPLVLLELKNPADEKADIWKAFDQIQTYKEQIPDVFQYNELLVISDGTEARLGSLSASMERFMAWRTIDGQTLGPLGQFNELETMIRGVLAPAFLLDFLRFFILFEDDGMLVKKIAGYHQFHAVRSAIDQVVAASRPGGTRKGGVVWHTQGSGKSITMTCFAARAMRESAMENPTVVVITDRNDLDGQLFGVFSLSYELLREQPVQGETRQDLRAKLANRPSGGIIFATIQKFMPGEDEDSFPILSDRHNIVVIADEAHRTQYGFEAKFKEDAKGYQVGYAQHLRDALPNATFVAFTGTPVASEDSDTRAVFGNYISIYDMQQARDDGATVAIYFESRLAKLGLKEDLLIDIDAEVDELAEDEEDDQQARLKSKWTALEKVVGAEPRIKQVAADLVAHFEERNQAQSGKAMLVAMSRDVCVHLYNAIIALRPEWHDEDPEKGVIKIVMTGSASDKPLLRPHIYAKQFKKRLEKRFKDPDDPMRLVIVRDMWLTGFDAHEAYSVLEEKLDILRAMLHGFDYSGFLTGGHSMLVKTANYLLGLKDGKKRFGDTALAMSKAFTLCCTLDEARAVRDEVAFFQAVKVLLTKRETSTKKRTDEERELAIRQIIGSALVSDDVVDIFQAVGLNNDELAFYDALANNEEAVREMGDEILKKIAHELAENLRQNIGVDWSVRESVRAKLRLMVKRILRKYKYPPDQQEAAVTLVLEQAETLSAEWA